MNTEFYQVINSRRLCWRNRRKRKMPCGLSKHLQRVTAKMIKRLKMRACHKKCMLMQCPAKNRRAL